MIGRRRGVGWEAVGAGSYRRGMRLLHTSDWHLGRTLHGVNLHEAQSACSTASASSSRTRPTACPSTRCSWPATSTTAACRPSSRCSSSSGRCRGCRRSRPSSSPRATTTRRSGSATAPRLFRDRIRMVTDLGRARPAGAARGQRRRAGRRLRHPLPRSRPRASCAGRRRRAAAALAPGRRRGGVRPHPRRPRGRVRASASVVLAHAFVAGAEPSDSERSIMVGGVDRVAGTVFHGIDYAALGHLHGPQAPESARRGRSCATPGSPLRYSFSEQDQHQGRAARRRRRRPGRRR